ncbi:MAG: hypothetical protein FWE35_26725 [Streptosporangiales bacterium]|nr:hypothetical protein [Streptosporangiales bacterium]
MTRTGGGCPAWAQRSRGGPAPGPASRTPIAAEATCSGVSSAHTRSLSQRSRVSGDWPVTVIPRSALPIRAIPAAAGRPWPATSPIVTRAPPPWDRASYQSPPTWFPDCVGW